MNAEIYADYDGDLIVVLRSEDRIRLASTSFCGHPKGGMQPIIVTSDPASSEDYSFITKIPTDLALLYIEHGCNTYDLEIDQAIWAAEYARSFSVVSNGDLSCSARFTLPPEGSAFTPAVASAKRLAARSLEAAKAADAAVLCRWYAKGAHDRAR